MLEVCEAIVEELGALCLPFPSTVEEWKEIAKKFSDRWNFPHCVGALDGKHVVIQAYGQGSLFYNNKSTHSIVLMVLAGSDYEIIWCNVGNTGRVSDGGVWNRTEFCTALENDEEVALPPPEPLANRTLPLICDCGR